MKFKVGDRVTMKHPWHDGYGVDITVVGVTQEGRTQFLNLKADEPCFDHGKYELSTDIEGVQSDYLERLEEGDDEEE